MKILQSKIDKIDGHEISLIRLENNNNFSIEFYNYGGYFHSINIPYKSDKLKTEDVLLGYQSFENYKFDKAYFNSIVGRVGGRIANSQFILNNITYKLSLNSFESDHHLHGGKKGFNKKVWNIEDLIEEEEYLQCRLSYCSSDMEEGYPGNLKCKVDYIFSNDNKLYINIAAETDRDTIVNITNHNYWNFHGHQNFHQDISEHYVQLNAEHYSETNADLIPSGNLLRTKNTKFDFQELTKIDNRILDNNGIDTCYSVKDFNGILRKVACAYSDLTKMGMTMYSDQPGLVFYTGNMMDNYYRGKYHRSYGYQYGMCFEPQLFPDAINQKNFKSPILRAGKEYKSSIVIELKNDF